MPAVFVLFTLCATFSNFASGQLVDLILKNGENVAEEARRLINDKGDEIVDEVNEEGMSAISAALQIKNLEIVQILVNHSLNLNVVIKGEDGYPLHTAIKMGWLPAVKLFLENNVDLELTNHRLHTALHYSIMYHNGEILTELLDKRERIGPIINAKNDDGVTALHLAAALEEPHGCKFVKALLGAGADIDCTTKDGRTPLHTAVIQNRLETVKLLLSQQANWRIMDKFNRRASEFTYNYLDGNEMHIHEEIISILEKAEGAGLVDLILKNKEKEVERLINDRGEKIVNEVNEEGKSAIYAALQVKNLKIVRILLEHHVNLNATLGSDAEYPLHRAIGMGWLPAVKLFLENNVDLQLGNGCLDTALHYCVIYYDGKILRELLDKKEIIGSVINAKNDDGDTALHLAAALEEPKGSRFVTALLVAGSDINSANKRGKTPLHEAVYNNRLETVKLLLSQQADVTIVDENDRRASDFMYHGSNEVEMQIRREIIRILRKAEGLVLGRPIVRGTLLSRVKRSALRMVNYH